MRARKGEIDPMTLIVWGIVILITLLGVLGRLREEFTEDGRREVKARRSIELQKRRCKSEKRCDKCHQLDRSTFFCAICGTVCGNCMMNCYILHKNCVQ